MREEELTHYYRDLLTERIDYNWYKGKCKERTYTLYRSTNQEYMTLPVGFMDLFVKHFIYEGSTLTVKYKDGNPLPHFKLIVQVY
jgi:hypothetical protein